MRLVNDGVRLGLPDYYVQWIRVYQNRLNLINGWLRGSPVVANV